MYLILLSLLGLACKKILKFEMFPKHFPQKHLTLHVLMFSWGQFYFSTAVSKCTNSPEAEEQFKNVKSVINITEISHRVESTRDDI